MMFALHLVFILTDGSQAQSPAQIMRQKDKGKLVYLGIASMGYNP